MQCYGTLYIYAAQLSASILRNRLLLFLLLIYRHCRVFIFFSPWATCRMRQKSPPYFLSKSARAALSFTHIPVLLPQVDTPRQCRKRPKNIPDARLDLSRSFDHSLTVFMDCGPCHRSNCLQSVTLPFSASLLVYFKRARRVDIYFCDSPQMALCFEDAASRERFVIMTDLPNLSFILYGLSSASLSVHGTVVADQLQVDVCVKSSAIFDTPNFIQYATSQQQFDKLFNFITLQIWPQDATLDSLRLPLFSQLSETQEEFITSLKAFYALIQSTHIRESAEWNDHNIVQPKEIKIDLLPYQIDAIRWMVFREGNSVPIVDQKWIYPYFVKINDENLFFSALSGHFRKALPDVPTDACLGGILADEMGLGKTLEIISVILLRPCEDQSDKPLYDLNTESDLVGEFAYRQVEDDVLSHFESPASPSNTETTEPMVEESVFCVCGGGVDASIAPQSGTVSCSRCSSASLQHEACVQFKRLIGTADGKCIRQNYICPLCWNSLRVHSKATLIISPDHIWRQWQDELLQHVDTSHLKILIYEGLTCPVTRLTHTSAWTSTPTKNAETGEVVFTPGFVQPAELATADIVLTTYTVIQRELGWAAVSTEQRVGEGHRPSLRTAQRYLAPPSPLACVIWWRICLDEAQMVEGVTSKTARMLSEVRAIHRWCVTGTPAEKSLIDFYGLLAYLRVEPFSYRHYWNGMLYQPFIEAIRSAEGVDLTTRISTTALVRVFSRLLWRNTKALIGDQLKLPSVTEQIHWVDFTTVERYIHDRVLSDCADALHQILAEEPNCDLNSPLATLSGSVHWRLVALVTRARQTCTHASLVVINSTAGLGGRGGGKSTSGACSGRRERGRCTGFRPSADPTLQVSRSGRLQGTGCATMSDVIRRVIDDVHQECEANYRTWVFNKNGAAACFILQEKFMEAATCYREVLRTATTLESRHGVLADWSQRLHSITNLHWLIQCCSVPLEKYEPQPTVEKKAALSEGLESSELPTWEQLDPRVDRDLVWKAKLLRMDYLKLHSRLLAKARDKLDPMVARVEKSLSPSEFPATRDNQDPWLMWLDEALNILGEADVLEQIPLIVVAGLQGRSQFRTTLLQTRSGAMFKALLLSELKTALDARRRLREAMAPLDHTWNCFLESGEADRKVLQKYYNCCARDDQQQQQREDAGKKPGVPKSPKPSPRKRQKRSPATKCAYCVASEALNVYRQAINHEKSTTRSARAQRRVELERILDDAEATHEADDDDLLSGDFKSVALINPFIVALQTVAAQVARVREPYEECWVKSLSGKLERLVQMLFRELLYTGRVQMLTKEWWNVHDDTEQFVLRLQATSPAELAFIKPEEVDSQLHQHSVDALATWSSLQNRLSHLSFLRNALQQHSTSSATSGVGALECPTCLQAQSPSRPTFVLLPGCWHSLCLPCHERIQAHGVPSQRRCPLCRKPFEAASNATKRRPLTLLHYDGGKKPQSADSPSDPKEEEITVIGDHSSKIQEVIRCLRRIKANDADAKAVVFSSWISVLYTIGRALDQNGIAFATLFKARDGKTLSGFRRYGSRTWVLLLPIRLGANGLNLTEANHVLLVDPVLNHGREVQAIARLHRIGQRRSCTVHRFLVRDSIETALHGISTRLDGTAKEDEEGAEEEEEKEAGEELGGPVEDRAQILQMTVAQLINLLKIVDVPSAGG
uniref:E3 ubiquitin-protein ligase SHPRH n=2 Tax=Mesocestoides corti TaxID=53468 RepID=A0A5K3EVH6_MESCO